MAHDFIPGIVNGTEVSVNDPIAKSIFMLTGKYQRFSFTCTGSILSKDLIVTAAHCQGPYGGADILQSGDLVILAGYGINVPAMPNRGDGGVGILRSVQQNILEPQYGNTEILINIKNKGTCSGDSGGLAFIQKDNEIYLFGVASRMTDKDIVPVSKVQKQN